MDYYSFTDPEGMEGWVGLVSWPIADALPTKWSHVNHGSGVDQGKSASYRPTTDVLTTEPRRNNIAYVCISANQPYTDSRRKTLTLVLNSTPQYAFN